MAVEDVTLEILKGIQAGIATLNERVSQLDERVNQLSEHVGGLSGRFDHLEAGMLVMMRATAGDFDARVAEVEERVAALEARAQ